MAKTESVRGYGMLNKHDLIDTILYHRRVVKPQFDDLSQLRKGRSQEVGIGGGSEGGWK